MLNDLIDVRNSAMVNFYLTESIQQLGIYNKSVKNLENYLKSQEYIDECNLLGYSFSDEINPMQTDFSTLSKIKIDYDEDIDDIDLYDVSIHPEYEI